MAKTLLLISNLLFSRREMSRASLITFSKWIELLCTICTNFKILGRSRFCLSQLISMPRMILRIGMMEFRGVLNS